jgi:TRAP-type C4-dicarboxylate transport system substrate-binding protein
MKNHRILVALLVLLMVFSIVTGCGNSATPSTPSTPPASGSGASTDSTAQPAADNQVYTLSFNSSRGTGSNRNVMVEEVLKKKLEDKSNGRLTIDIYPSNTLAAQGEMLDALIGGTVDMGYMNGTMFAGQFPYTELLGTPGLKLGSIKEVNALLQDYSKAFVEDPYKDLYIVVRYATSQFGFVTVNPIRTTNDLKGLSLRSTPNFVPWFTNMGVSCVSMSAADVYESMKTNVISGTCTGISGITSYNLGEVANYFTSLKMITSDEMIVMSKSAYDSLPADLQAIVDETSAEMLQILEEFTIFEQDEAIEIAQSDNANFQMIELTSEAEADFISYAMPILEAKAKELDSAGLKGTDALNWLKERQK